MSRALASVLFLALAGCVKRAPATPLEPQYGWFRADLLPEGDAYEKRFARIAARLEAVDCGELAALQRDATQPIYVLVHGAGGENVEMHRTVPLLVAAKPAAVLMFRWTPWDTRDALTARFAGGLSHLARCVPGAPGRIVVIAHSAGGVLVSLAAGRLVPPDGAPASWLMLLTVAAPLAGAFPLPDNGPEPSFMWDLASTPRYPPPAKGVRVMHLRTQVSGDTQMTPIIGHPPNDPRAGVPGAPQLDLPATLTHAGALVYVARRLVDGSFARWAEQGAALAAGSALLR